MNSENSKSSMPKLPFLENKTAKFKLGENDLLEYRNRFADKIALAKKIFSEVACVKSAVQACLFLEKNHGIHIATIPPKFPEESLEEGKGAYTCFNGLVSPDLVREFTLAKVELPSNFNLKPVGYTFAHFPAERKAIEVTTAVPVTMCVVPFRDYSNQQWTQLTAAEFDFFKNL